MYQPEPRPRSARALTAAIVMLLALAAGTAVLVWSHGAGDVPADGPAPVFRLPDAAAFLLIAVAALAVRPLGRALAALLVAKGSPAARTSADPREEMIHAAAPPLLWLMVGVQALAVWSALAPGMLSGNATALNRGVAAAVFAFGLFCLALGMADLVPLRVAGRATDGHRLLSAIRRARLSA